VDGCGQGISTAQYNTQHTLYNTMVGSSVKKMSLAEFIEDSSLGEPASWVDDDFDLTSALAGDQFQHNNTYTSNGRVNVNSRSRVIVSADAGGRYIVEISNLGKFFTRQLLREFFDSRYTKLVDIHVFPNLIAGGNTGKIAIVWLPGTAEFNKVMKWDGVNVEGCRIRVRDITPAMVENIIQRIEQSGFDEDEEERRIESGSGGGMSNGPRGRVIAERHSMPQSNPFGNAKPVNAREYPLVSENAREVAKALAAVRATKAKANATTSATPAVVTPKVNPFGNAKPVLVKEIPLVSENTRELAKKLHLLDLADSGEKKNVTARDGNTINDGEMAKVSDKPKVKSNPFGNAKPIDTLSKQMEIEKKLEKAFVNETTFNLALLHKKERKRDRKREKEKDKEREVEAEGEVEVEGEKEVSEEHGIKARMDRRKARDVSKEEYESELRKVKSLDGSAVVGVEDAGEHLPKERRRSRVSRRGSKVKTEADDHEKEKEKRNTTETVIEETAGDTDTTAEGTNPGLEADNVMESTESTSTEESSPSRGHSQRGRGRVRGRGGRGGRGFRGRGRGSGRGGAGAPAPAAEASTSDPTTGTAIRGERTRDGHYKNLVYQKPV
jgi:uncharacterized membrane protein YgcG